MNPGILKVLIVDDEPIARRILREELDAMPEAQVIGEAESGPEALRQIIDLRPDLVLLDLQMPLMNGFEVVRNLSGSYLPAIVIVTAYQEHAIEAFEAGAVDYLLKPVSPARLRKALGRARSLVGRPREIAATLVRIAAASEPPLPRKIVGRLGRDYFLLDPEEVIALQAEGELVWIVTPKRRLLATGTLRSIEAELLGTGFQRVHRNAIVNVNHVRKMTSLSSHRWMLTLSNRLELVVSKRQAHHVRRLLDS